MKLRVPLPNSAFNNTPLELVNNNGTILVNMKQLIIIARTHHHPYTAPKLFKTTIVTSRNLGMVDNSSKSNGGFRFHEQLHRVHQWQPETILSDPYKAAGRGHGCLILNREIKIPNHVVKNLWENASLRCCVDGGANRWLHFIRSLKNNDDDCSISLREPDLITGDFDSITAETSEYFAKKGIKRIHTPDQNHTDFSKAVDIIKPLLKDKQLQDIIVLHDTSGRFDQIMSNINTLYTRNDDSCNIYLLGRSSLTWLLQPGKHSIDIPAHLVEEQRWCSLIPVGQKVTNVTTTGLKWNLTRASLFFGGMVSSSNTYASTSIEIETDTDLIWSMGVFRFGDD